MAFFGPVYLLGPSSVGKSHLCVEVARELGITVRDLDTELGVPALLNWSCVSPWLESVSGEPALVDIGAGTQHACGAELARYLVPRRDRVVLVMDDPEAAFARNVAAGHRGPHDRE